MIDLKAKANEFYYKNIWQSGYLVRAYIDKFGNFSKRPSAFYIGTFDEKTKCEDFYEEVERRVEEHKRAYSVGSSIPSGLGKYAAQMRKTVTDWEE